MLTLASTGNHDTVVTFDEEGPFVAMSHDRGATIGRLAGFWAEPNERHVWNPQDGVLHVLLETDGVWHLNGVPLQTSDVDMSEALKLPGRELMFAMEDAHRRELIILMRNQPLGLAWSLQAYIGELPEDLSARSMTLTTRHTPTPMSGSEGLSGITVQLGGDDACRVVYSPDGVVFFRLRAGRIDCRLTEVPHPQNCRWFFDDVSETTITLMRPEMPAS